MVARCENTLCNIPLAPERMNYVYCDVCQSMLDALGGKPGLLQAADEYKAENVTRARRKAVMLGESQTEDNTDAQS